MTAISPTATYEVPRTEALVTVSVTLLLAFQLLNLATHNLQPETVQKGVEALSLLGFAGVFGLALLHATGATALHVAGCMLLIGAAMVGLVRYPEQASAIEMVKMTIGPIVLGLLTVRWRAPPPAPLLWLLWLISIGGVLLGSYVAFTGVPYMNGESERLAVFAGGETGLHPSAYAMTCFALMLLVLLRARIGLWFVTLPVLCVAAATIYGYGVRTAWLMFIVFAGVLVFQWLWHRSKWMTVVAAGLALILLAGGLAILSSANIDWLTFTSGRSAIYGERLAYVGSRNVADFLFGSGAGTDLMRGVSAWRWAAKDSHNDFMTLLIEMGAVGLIGFVMILIAALWAAPAGYKAWVLMMIASALVSNGVLLRPSIAPPLIFIAFIAITMRDQFAARERWSEVSADGQRFAYPAE